MKSFDEIDPQTIELIKSFHSYMQKRIFEQLNGTGNKLNIIDN